jgi:hypothetical protein
MLKKAIIRGAVAAAALLGAAGVAYADSSDAVHDFSADNGANHNIDTGHFLGFLSI